MSCKVIKKSALKGAAPKLTKGAAVSPGLVIVDNEDGRTFTVMGTNQAGNPVDISALATLTPPPSSSDPTVLTVDPPVGMTSAFHEVGKPPKLGTATVSVSATANDGSFGPFTAAMDVTVSAGGPTGITIVITGPTVPPTP